MMASGVVNRNRPSGLTPISDEELAFVIQVGGLRSLRLKCLFGKLFRFQSQEIEEFQMSSCQKDYELQLWLTDEMYEQQRLPSRRNAESTTSSTFRPPASASWQASLQQDDRSLRPRNAQRQRPVDPMDVSRTVGAGVASVSWLALKL